MYGREQRVLLRHYLERGLSKAEVARELGVSRRTVYHWLATGQLDRELDKAVVQYASRPAVACKIDAFRPIIDTRLAEFPKLTTTRLFDEIRAVGYEGGYTQVKEYVREVRPAPAPTPLCASRRRQATKRKSTLPSFACHGASATRCWSCWAIRG